MIDLRSDTFTKPSKEMLDFMLQAEVGDDVFKEDPTVNLLEEKVAQMFGMEASLFCPTGTMTNQIAIKCHTNPGEEIICEYNSHVYIYEGGGIAFNSGCQVRPITGNRGRISAEQIIEHINPNDIHRPPTTLVSIENTCNRGGGSCYELEEIIKLKNTCEKYKLKLHLDGARIWNSIIYIGYSSFELGKYFDSISVCFSKGLGAPVGSVLIGNSAFIEKARRIRKLMGGGMRQAGYLAAACNFALENNIDRLSQDHKHAKIIEAALLKKKFVTKILPVETNMIIFELSGKYTAHSFVSYLQQQHIQCIAIADHQIRMVTHLDISPEMVDNIVHCIDIA